MLAHLRLSKVMRHPSGHTQKNRQIKNAVSIRERPAEAEDRAVPGHWEGDLLIGANNSQIATLLERHTRYCMLVRVNSKHTETVVDALVKQAHKLPRELYKSLTWDRGKEMADHQRFPKGMDLSAVHQNRLNAVARRLNERPGKTLGYYSPAEKFAECIAATDLNRNPIRTFSDPEKA